MLTMTNFMRMPLIIDGSLRMLVLSVAAGCAVCTAVSWGQVRPIQGGNALDANPLAGSGGYNAARPATTGINGNLIVSGNVTAGRAFRGFSPIQNQDTLMTNIPSADISNFIRDSVGLPSISGGQNNYSPRPFFYPTNTAVANATIQNIALLPRQATGTFSVNQYQSQMPISPLTGTLSPNQIVPELPYAAPTWQPAGLGMFRPDITMGQGNPLTPYPISSPAEVSGVRTATNTTDRNENNRNVAGQRTTETVTEVVNPDLSERPHAGPLAIQPSTIGGTPAANLALLPGATNAARRETSQDNVTSANQADWQANTGQMAEGNTEATSTLLTTMERYAKMIQETVSPEEAKMETPLEAAARTPADKMMLLPPGMTEGQRMRAQTDINRQQAAQLVEARLKAPIRTLAGTKRTQVDQILARAEGLMQQGQYYQAAYVYGGIIATTPDNPLAWLGRANALLAAGDYVSAYMALEQGTRRFPQMLQFNFDLPALVGNREVLDVRRAEIEQALAVRPNYQMQFLLGYLEYFSGLKDLGLQTLKQAAQAAPSGSVVAEVYQILAKEQAGTTRPAK